MVCVIITRDRLRIEDNTAIAIRDACWRAVVKVMKVKAEDVEVQVREVGPLDLNSGELGIEIHTGSGKDAWRITASSEILAGLNEAIVHLIPKGLQAKGKSNMWLCIFAKGASMPIGCPELMH